MTVPLTNSDGPAVCRRVSTSCTPHWQRFQAAARTSTSQIATPTSEIHPYHRQYSHVYHQRLVQLAKRCRDTYELKEQIGSGAEVEHVHRLLELEDEVMSFVVGTLVKEPSPNTKDPGEPVISGTECRASDMLYLEDESGRVTLQFRKHEEHHIHEYCTGLVVGVKGKVSRGGLFMVEAMVLPSVPSSGSLTSPAVTNTKHGPFLLLLSGIHCGSTAHPTLKRDMLLTFLEGRLSHPASAYVSRVVVCGGLIASDNEDARSLSSTTDSLLDLDAFLFQVTAGAGLTVDVLPGLDDPTTANWPQRPLHSSLLLQSTNFGLVNLSPNPYDSSHEDCRLVATDGTNVRDLQKQILKRTQPLQEEGEDTFSQLTELEALRKQLEFGHICPTGPASVPTVPHALSDPMVLKSLPHVYVAGNCSHFATEALSLGVGNHVCRLLCLPTFSQTGEAVLLNLQTLDVELLRFEGDD